VRGKGAAGRKNLSRRAKNPKKHGIDEQKKVEDEGETVCSLLLPPKSGKRKRWKGRGEDK